MGNDAYNNMMEGDKADLHDNWVQQQEHAVELDGLMSRLKACYEKRHTEVPFDAHLYQWTRNCWKFRVSELREWVEKMEKEDAE